jgi:hypothetical protein
MSSAPTLEQVKRIVYLRKSANPRAKTGHLYEQVARENGYATWSQMRAKITSHEFNDLGACVHCGLDGREWQWWVESNAGKDVDVSLPHCKRNSGGDPPDKP